MTEASRSYKLIISDTATTELRDLKRRDSDSFDALIVLLQEIRSDARTCEQLIDEHYADHAVRMVDPFRAAQSEGLNAYTVKLFEVGSWRLITAGDHGARMVAIMSVMHRSRNYEADAALMAQLRRDYDALGFKRLPKI
jgi:mRNA-degrading endonuclease RelE of RelBE toxin-antitoxin system